MKTVLTATGIDALNDMLQKQDNIDVLHIDIQKQEKLYEMLLLEEYSNADVLVIIDELSGPDSKKQMIDIVKQRFRGKIYIILREEDDDRYIKYLRELKITDIFSENDDPNELIDTIIYDGISSKDIEGFSNKESQNEVEIEKIYIQKQVIAVIGPGGIGKTTIALNLAHILEKSKYEVCVVDLNFEKPDIAHITGVNEKGIQSILKKDFDENLILESVTEKRNIYYLTGLKEMIHIDEAFKEVKGIIKVLRKHYDVVILDTGNISSLATHTAICESDQQVLILNPAERNIKAAKRYLDLYNNQLNIKLNAVGMSNMHVDTDIDIKEMKQILEIKIYGKIKYDKRIFLANEKGKYLNDKNRKAIEELQLGLFPIKKKPFKLFRGR